MKHKTAALLTLHALLAVYSACGICSKMAAGEAFLSWRFCLFYGLEILLLGVYAVGWQQIIKRLALTTAFANKAVTVVWGLLWGSLLFGERVTLGKLAGALLIMAGVVLFVFADRGPSAQDGAAVPQEKPGARL